MYLMGKFGLGNALGVDTDTRRQLVEVAAMSSMAHIGYMGWTTFTRNWDPHVFKNAIRGFVIYTTVASVLVASFIVLQPDSHCSCQVGAHALLLEHAPLTFAREKIL